MKKEWYITNKEPKEIHKLHTSYTTVVWKFVSLIMTIQFRLGNITLYLTSLTYINLITSLIGASVWFTIRMDSKFMNLQIGLSNKGPFAVRVIALILFINLPITLQPHPYLMMTLNMQLQTSLCGVLLRAVLVRTGVDLLTTLT